MYEVISPFNRRGRNKNIHFAKFNLSLQEWILQILSNQTRKCLTPDTILPGRAELIFLSSHDVILFLVTCFAQSRRSWEIIEVGLLTSCSGFSLQKILVLAHSLACKEDFVHQINLRINCVYHKVGISVLGS